MKLVFLIISLTMMTSTVHAVKGPQTGPTVTGRTENLDCDVLKDSIVEAIKYYDLEMNRLGVSIYTKDGKQEEHRKQADNLLNLSHKLAI